jgi:hypothetical protein
MCLLYTPGLIIYTGNPISKLIRWDVGKETLKIFKRLVKLNPSASIHGSEYPIPGYTPLSCAAEEGSTEWVKILLKHGANPNVCNNTDRYRFSPLNTSVSRQRIEIVKILMKAGANPLLEGTDSPLYTALWIYNQKKEHGSIEDVRIALEIIKYLLKPSTDYDIFTDIPFNLIARFNDADVNKLYCQQYNLYLKRLFDNEVTGTSKAGLRLGIRANEALRIVRMNHYANEIKGKTAAFKTRLAAAAAAAAAEAQRANS